MPALSTRKSWLLQHQEHDSLILHITAQHGNTMTLVKTFTYIVIQQATHANTEDAPTRIIWQGEL